MSINLDTLEKLQTAPLSSKITSRLLRKRHHYYDPKHPCNTVQIPKPRLEHWVAVFLSLLLTEHLSHLTCTQERGCVGTTISASDTKEGGEWKVSHCSGSKVCLFTQWLWDDFLFLWGFRQTDWNSNLKWVVREKTFMSSISIDTWMQL